MKTVSRVYDTYAQARDAVAAVEASGVPTDDLSVVANKYVSEKYADVHEVPAPAATGAGVVGCVAAHHQRERPDWTGVAMLSPRRAKAPGWVLCLLSVARERRWPRAVAPPLPFAGAA